VRLEAPDEVVDPIRAALDSGHALELTYLGAARDEVTERMVDPAEVVVIDGYAYLRAWCRQAAGMRLFRLDRILQLRVSAQAAQAPRDAPGQVEPMAATLAATGRTVVVDVPAGSTLTDRHPVLRRWQLPDGGTRAELPVGDYSWARRLVLGGAGEVILREPTWLADTVVEDAARALSALG
jgi:proteasome accessory factor C